MRAERANAVFALYPQAVNIIEDAVYDADGNEVEYDLEAVEAKAEADAQAAIDAKAVAEAKLAKLGLTPDDLKALLG